MGYDVKSGEIISPEVFVALQKERDDGSDRAKELMEKIRAMEQAPTPIQRETLKVGRNDPCPCGSGAKFKKCCLEPEDAREQVRHFIAETEHADY